VPIAIVVYIILVLGLSYLNLLGCSGFEYEYFNIIEGALLFLSVILFPVLILLIILGILSFWIKKIRKYRRRILINISVIVIIIITFIIVNKVEIEYSMDAKKSGEKLVTAIEKYRTDNGKLPSNLSQLTPDYITETPTCYLGQNFRYFQYGENYEVWYNNCAFLIEKYYSERNQWVSDS